MPAINKVIIAGNLTKEPELRQTGQGVSVVSLSVAVNESYKDKAGEWKKTATFFNVVAWNKTAEYAHKYLRKGNAVFVEGKLQTRSYENKEGQKVYITEINASTIQSLSGKPESGDRPAADDSGSHGKTVRQPDLAAPSQDDFYGDAGDDSVPF